MRNARTFILALIVSLGSACLASAAGAGIQIPADWKPVGQPDLKQQFDAAQPLKIENLGVAVTGIDDPNSSGKNLVPHADGKGWDALLWYRKVYARNTSVQIIDLATGQVKKQDFTAEEGRVRVEMGFTWWGVFAEDGKLYGADPDLSTWNTGGAMNIYRYDPAEKKVSLFKVIPGHGGERNPLELSPNGWIYGAGTTCAPGPDRFAKASAYGFNPKTGEVRDFGPIGPRINGTGYGYTAGACDTHFYVACGQIPWYLVAVDVKTGEQKTLLTAPEGGYVYRMQISDHHYGGAVCFVQQGDDAPKKYYWLYHGAAIPKKTDGFQMDDSCPWKPQPSPLEKFGAPPQLSLGQTYPDENGKATLWWRPETGKGVWQAIHYSDVETFPLSLHRFCPLPDGRIFGSAAAYKGRFLFDPKTGKVTPLGNGGGSLYALAVLGGKVYWSGYPSAPIYEYDPARPYTLAKSYDPNGAPILESSTESNPRLVHENYLAVYEKTRVKKMLSATVAADGCVYFGGRGERDYHGGGLSWYNPKTGAVDGLWQPFANRDIGWVTTALHGRYVVIGTHGDKAALFDTEAHKLIGDMVTVPGAKKSGPILEVGLAPDGKAGRMLGITNDPEVKGGAILFGIEAPSGNVLFRKKIPYEVPFLWTDGVDRWDYKLGPDGFVWATIGRDLVRIDPRDAGVQVMGKLDVFGDMAFSGRDLYLTGTEQIRRIKDIVPAQ